MSNEMPAAVRRIYEGMLAEEGITPEQLEMVDLDITYNPVIAVRGEGLDSAAEVRKTEGGRYIVDHPMVEAAIDAEGLKVMRLRFLKARDEQLGRQYQTMIDMFTGR